MIKDKNGGLRFSTPPRTADGDFWGKAQEDPHLLTPGGWRQRSCPCLGVRRGEKVLLDGGGIPQDLQLGGGLEGLRCHVSIPVYPYPRGQHWLQPCPPTAGVGGLQDCPHRQEGQQPQSVPQSVCPAGHSPPALSPQRAQLPRAGREGRERTDTATGASSQDRWRCGKLCGWLDRIETHGQLTFRPESFMSTWTPGHESVHLCAHQCHHPCVHLFPSWGELEDSGQAALSSQTHGQGCGLLDVQREMAGWMDGQMDGWTQKWLDRQA